MAKLVQLMMLSVSPNSLIPSESDLSMVKHKITNLGNDYNYCIILLLLSDDLIADLCNDVSWYSELLKQYCKEFQSLIATYKIDTEVKLFSEYTIAIVNSEKKH